jgi:hypothetical protein
MMIVSDVGVVSIHGADEPNGFVGAWGASGTADAALRPSFV